MQRRLEPDDYLYRVIDPEHRDAAGPLAIAFQDPGKPYESLSFFVARVATPADALQSLARFKRAQSVCGNKRPSPADMYASGYRVARLPAKLVLDAIAQTKHSNRPVTIKPCEEGDYEANGHLNLHNGKYYAQILSSGANGLILLSERETLGTQSS